MLITWREIIFQVSGGFPCQPYAPGGHEKWGVCRMSEKMTNSKLSQQTHFAANKQTNKQRQGSWTQFFFSPLSDSTHVLFFFKLWIPFFPQRSKSHNKLIKLWMIFAQLSQSRKSLGRATRSPPHVGPPPPRRGETWRWIILMSHAQAGRGGSLGVYDSYLLNFSCLGSHLQRSAGRWALKALEYSWGHLKTSIAMEGSCKALHGSLKDLQFTQLLESPIRLLEGPIRLLEDPEDRWRPLKTLIYSWKTLGESWKAMKNY